MLNFILSFTLASASCDWGKYDNPNYPTSGPECYDCSSACGDCTGPTEFECTQCSSSYSEIQGICMASCPLGYTNNANICSSSTSDGIAYSLDFTQLTNTVDESVAVDSKDIKISAGNSESFYPYYDSNDPYTIKSRGFYYNGSAYLKNNDVDVTFGPVFTIAMWIKPTSGTGYLFCKQSSSSIYVSISIQDYLPSFSFYLSGVQTFSGSKVLTSSEWNFLMIKLTLSNYKAVAGITVNTNSVSSSTYSSYFKDIYSSFYTTYGATFSSSTYSNFYTGYMWSFQLGSNDISASTFIQTSNCEGCSYCPASNSNECLSNCSFTQYIENNTCIDCQSTCQTSGCVRSDKTCNLCEDIKCLNCTNFGEGCIYCKKNAYLETSSLCVCYDGYIWDDYYEKCRQCPRNCKTCDGNGYLGCSACNDGYYMHLGMCLLYCPTGYEISGNECILSGSKRILDMLFDKVQGVVYDSYNNIPAVTGTSSTFYPNYESDDPIAAYDRGYYFLGTSLMHFAPYDTYTTPYLIFSSVCYIGIWFNPSEPTGILYSSITDEYNTIVQYSISDLTPKIVIGLYNIENDDYTYPSVSCASNAIKNEWNYVVFKMTLDEKGKTYVTCYVNKVSGGENEVGEGIFLDAANTNYMLVGTQKTSSGYDSSYYTGFIYHIVVDVDIDFPNAEITDPCTGGCSYCISNGTCLSDCNLTSYSSGSNYDDCSPCNVNCTYGCIDDSDSCNICGDPGCKVCTSYDPDDCTEYFCADGTYLDKSSGNCLNCDSSCNTCKGSGPLNCLSCSTGYLLNGACHSFCPTGFSSSSNKCTKTLNHILSLNLLEIKGLVPDTQSNFITITGNSSNFYPSFDPYDPWPQIYRGYYFNGASYLQLPPNSEDSNLITFGNMFTISLWFKTVQSGTLLAKQDSSYNSYLLISIVSSKLKVTLNLDSSYSVTSSETLASIWTYAIITVKYTSQSLTSVTFIINGVTETLSAGSGAYADVTSAFTMTIGAQYSNSGLSNYWTGYLYMFDIYSSATTLTDYTTSCDTSKFTCSICPESTEACIDDCSYNYWYDGNHCEECQESLYDSCRRNDKNCNLCMDIQCKVCDTYERGSCSECVEHATLDSEYNCDCSDGYTWDSQEEACVVCDPMVKVKLQGVCLDSCPTGYTNSSGNCEGTPEKIFNIQMDKLISGSLTDTINGEITLTTGLSSEFYPYYDDDDPYAGKDRGYYFNGYSSYLNFESSIYNSNQLVLSPEFSIEFWLYPVTGGVIFTKQISSNLGIKIEITSDKSVQVSAKLSGSASTSIVTSTNLISFNNWNYIGVTCSLAEDLSTSITLQVNSNTETQSLGSFPYIDSSSGYTCTVGAEYNSSNILNNYYTGYIQSITVWNGDTDLSGQFSTSCTGGCSICPTSGTCLPSCGLSKYYSSTCKNCNNYCVKGCVRGEDCNLCYDRLCEICSDYTSSGCSKCVDGASFVSGVCKCDSGSAKTRTNGNYYCDTSCMANCKSCYSSFEGDCISCNDGFVLDSNGICVPECQTGYSSQSGKCVAKNANAKILHYVFNATINNPKDKTAGLKAYMGSTSNYLGNFDINDPIPYYKRGIYFNGNNKYVQLPPNPEESTNIILGNTHSIKFWLRPKSTSSQGCLLSKESSESLIYIYLTSTLTPKAEYSLLNIYSGSSTSLTTTGNSLQANTWQELVFVFKRSGRSSTGVFYINGKKSSRSYTKKSFLSESKDLYLKLGYSPVKDTSFNGFIYEFIIYNYAINPTNPNNNPCYCDLCTDTGDCFNTCEITEYLLPDNSCQTCPNKCTSGCRSSSNCGQNEDPLCEEYSGYESKDCTKCINLAESTQSGCKCVKNSEQVSNTCVCKSNYEQVGNSCDPCFYHLQVSDIDGYFSEDYLSLVFDFNQAVQSSSSSKCQDLFVQSTLDLLGDSPTCKWTNSFKGLIVTFGDDAGVVDGTEVSFNQNSLLTNTAVCGSFRGPIEITVYFKYEVPEIYPQAVVDAPDDYYIYCGDLFISGTQSTGGYGRSLKFSWKFESTPYIEAFNLTDNTQSSYTFTNETLEESTVTSYLTVTNWLGFNNTASYNTSLYEGVGINLVIDKDIVWTLTTQMSKSIYVQATSLCKISDNLTYAWSLYSKEGKDASIDEDLFWSSQKSPSKLFIPKGSLGPGYYVFQLIVHDNELGVSGKTYLRFRVLYSDLEVFFNPPYKTVNRQSDLSLDGAIAYDPDQINENMEYQWNCSGVSGCDSLIQGKGNKVAKISKSDLVDLQEYVFTLQVTKGSRSAAGVLTVLVNDSSSISVTFDKVPKYINNQENFVIRSKLLPACNCTYHWDVTGGPYELSTEVTSKDIGLVPYSLTEGSDYQAKLTVTDEFGKDSVFKVNFIVNIPPQSGKLTISKSSGTELTTWFYLRASGWSDPEDSSNPLTYQFGYYKSNQTYYLNVRNESNYLWTKLPNGNPLEIFVRVYDIYGSYSETIINVNIESTVLDPQGLLTTFDGLIKLAWVDPDILVGYLCNLAWGLTGQELNDTYNDQAIEKSIDVIEKLRDSLQEIDFSKIDVLLKLTGVTTLYSLNSTYKVDLNALLITFTEIIYDQAVIMSASRANSYIDVLLKLVSFSPNMVKTSAEDLSNVNENIKQLSIASSLTMGQTQSILFGSAPIQSHLKLYQGDKLISYETPPEFNNSYITLPNHHSLDFNSSSTIMTILTVYNADPSLYNNNSTEHSAIVEFSIVEIINNTQTILYLDFEDQTINISIPIWYLNDYPPKCKFWGTRKWMGTGCKLLEFGTDNSVCGCSHTSLYTSGSLFGGSSGDDEGPILIYIVCILAFLWLFLACCLLVKDKKEANSKIFVGKILAGLPVSGKKSARFIPNEVADQLGKELPEGSRKGTVHVPPSRIEVVGMQNEVNLEPHSENLSGKFKQNQSSKYEKLQKDDEDEDEIRNRRLALPTGYQILPTLSFLQEKQEQKKEKYVEADSFKPVGTYQVIEKIPDYQESEKAAGYAFKDRMAGVTDLKFSDDSVPKTSEYQFTSTAHFPEIKKFESGHSAKPKSEITSTSSGQLKGPGTVKINTLEFPQGVNYGEKHESEHAEYIPRPKLQQVTDLEEFNLPKGDGKNEDFYNEARKDKPFESKKNSGQFSKPPPGGAYMPVDRLAKVTSFDHANMMKIENEGRNVNSSELEFGKRPSTDGKKMNKDLEATMTANVNVKAYEDKDSNSRLPTSYSGNIPPPVPKIPGLTELKMEEIEVEEIGKQPRETYAQRIKLQGVSEWNMERVEVSSYNNESGMPSLKYTPGARLQGVTNLEIENSKMPPTNDLGLPNIEFSDRPRLEGVTEFKEHPAKLPDVNLQNINFTNRANLPGLTKYVEGNLEHIRSPLESPDNQDFERKAFIAHDEKGLSKASNKDDMVAEDLSDKRPTQPHEDKNSNKKKFNFDQYEESKEPYKSQANEYIKAHLNNPADEKLPENTELFTLPDSPHARHMIRGKKGADQEVQMYDEINHVIYPSFIADYFFSAILFYHENYSRFSRCAQGVCSFFLQTILIGLIIDGMGSTYANDKGQSFDSQVKGLLFQDVAISFSMVIVSNLLMGLLVCLLFRRPALIPGMEATYRTKRNEFIGLVIVLVIIFGTVIGVGLLEMTMAHTMSMLWVICLFIAFIFDFFIIQLLKVLVYNYFSPSFIFPS